MNLQAYEVPDLLNEVLKRSSQMKFVNEFQIEFFNRKPIGRTLADRASPKQE